MFHLRAQFVRRALEVVRGLWLTPLLIALAGVALGIAAPLVDEIPDVYASLRVGFIRSVVGSSAEGARSLLAAGAGALATILGVAFSLTLVTLELAAAQYTTRVIARFTDDRVTKLVLGAYIGSVAYLLLVLRAVHERDGVEFVPRLSLAFGLVLFLSCLALLAYFLNHLGTVIQASSIVTSVAKRTIETFRDLQHGDDTDDWIEPGGDPTIVHAKGPGYVQIIDAARVAKAVPRRTHVRVEVRPGDFIVAGSVVASLWPPGDVSEEEYRALARAVSVGHVRTEDQDVLLGVQRLNDIALRALSPSINDETTAILALNELAVVALEVGRRGGHEPVGRIVYRRGGTAVMIRYPDLARVLDEGFRGICRFSADHPRVLARIAEVLATLSEQLAGTAERNAIARAAGWVRFSIERSTLMPDDRALVEDRLRSVRHAARGDEPSLDSLSPAIDEIPGGSAEHLRG